MNKLIELAVRIFGILAALFTAKKLGRTEAEKDQLEDNQEALVNDAKIDNDYRDIDDDAAESRMLEKVRKRNARLSRSR